VAHGVEPSEPLLSTVRDRQLKWRDTVDNHITSGYIRYCRTTCIKIANGRQGIGCSSDFKKLHRDVW